MDISTFNFNSSNIRVLLINNEPWFNANDAFSILDIQSKGGKSDALADLDEDERGSFKTNTNGGIQEMVFVSESGLYSLIIRSRKPIAKPFQKWVTREVLPSIRKTGSYSISQPVQTSFSIPEIGNSTQKIIELKNDVLETSNLIEILRNLNPIDLFRLDIFYRKTHNFFILQYFEIDLSSQYFLPTELGRMINKSPVEINLMIEKKGFQVRENGVWKLTDLGRDFGIEINGNFSQIKWKIRTVL